MARRTPTAFTLLAIVTSGLLAAPAAHAAVPPMPTPTPTMRQLVPSCRAEVTVTESWPNGYLAEVVVTGGHDGTGGWRVTLAADVAYAWNSRLVDGDLVNAPWNGTLTPWRETTAGFIGVGAAPAQIDAHCAGSPTPY